VWRSNETKEAAEAMNEREKEDEEAVAPSSPYELPLPLWLRAIIPPPRPTPNRPPTRTPRDRKPWPHHFLTGSLGYGGNCSVVRSERRRAFGRAAA